MLLENDFTLLDHALEMYLDEIQAFYHIISKKWLVLCIFAWYGRVDSRDSVGTKIVS